MPQIHSDLAAHIARARASTDPDVAIEELEAAVAAIDKAVGWKQNRKDVANPTDTVDVTLTHARTHVRNDDLGSCRLCLCQVIDAGGPEPQAVPEGKGLDDMTKAELQAYAKGRGYDVAAATNKAPLLEQIKELDTEAARATA